MEILNKEVAKLEHLKVAGDVFGYYHNKHKEYSALAYKASFAEQDAQRAYDAQLYITNRLRDEWKQYQRRNFNV